MTAVEVLARWVRQRGAASGGGTEAEAGGRAAPAGAPARASAVREAARVAAVWAPALPSRSPFQRRCHEVAHFARVAADARPGRLERLGLRLGRARRAGDDGPGVAHPLAGRRAEPRDVGDHRLGHPLLDVLGRTLLIAPADLPDPDHGSGLGIVLEPGQGVDEPD